ncbi:hypothetical protein [Bacillus wiedmannii]|uniref:hypothetical protein n=1 Tax=Bacillus wiedmannii TaxID=1890302 RepID=UPI000CD81904|nr:hypothetical protein [Bacillus wiedmannii]MED3079159.1 hypothetical protein [Bacillus wiedmannii]UOB94158.1 hypothetical protein BTI679_14810 [Bacillus wiedmannii]
MNNISMDLQKKIDMLSLHPMSNLIYAKYLMPYEDRESNLKRYKYYKIYGQEPVFYSESYLMDSTLGVLLEQDELNHKRFCPSLFVRVKNKIDVWKLKGLMMITGWLKKYSTGRSKDAK